MHDNERNQEMALPLVTGEVEWPEHYVWPVHCELPNQWSPTVDPTILYQKGDMGTDEYSPFMRRVRDYQRILLATPSRDYHLPFAVFSDGLANPWPPHAEPEFQDKTLASGLKIKADIYRAVYYMTYGRQVICVPSGRPEVAKKRQRRQ